LGALVGFSRGFATLNAFYVPQPSFSNFKKSVQPLIPTSNVEIPILVYHYIEYVKDPNDAIRKSLNIIPPIFEEQVKTLKKAGFNFITASDVGEYLDGKKALPVKPVVLTFDDGYEDFYTDVLPILRKNDVKATAYIISGVINKPNYMTEAQIREVNESGLVEIGAHTVDHPNLESLLPDEAKKEIVESKTMLENKFGIDVVSFAYPYGNYNDAIASFVKNAGYTNAVTTRGGITVNQQSRFTLFRIHPGIAIGEELLNEL
jgi:peptidoglycan/xylan/chitin deacetylase (PgdA/CDA1 family)